MNLKHAILTISLFLLSNTIFSKTITNNPKVDFDSYLEFGQQCAKEILADGAKPLMEKLRKALKVK